MKFSIISLLILSLYLGGCTQNDYHIMEGSVESGPVCAKLSSGEKQTFPSMEELSNTPDASYLYDGPCYDY